MPLSLRLAEDQADAIMVFRAACAMHAEGCVPGPLDKMKCLHNIVRMVQGPGGALLMSMDGDILTGFLGLWEERYWYSDERFLSDKGFYVLPDHRDGESAKLLLDAAKNLSDDTGLPVFITINNIQRRRGGRSDWERLGATLGYNPQGAVLAHFPGD